MEHRRNTASLILRATILIGLVLFLVANPSARAGHLTTSPATLSLPGLPVPDAVVFRGTTLRNSTSATDVPIGLVGRATGSATGFEGLVVGTFGEATGNAVGQDSAIIGVRGRTTGNATGPASGILGVQGRVIGNATGSDSALVGVQGRVTGNFTGQNAFIVGVHGRVDGIPTGPGATATGVFGVTRGTSGNGVGVSGTSFSTSGVGVFGNANASSGDANGVVGQGASPNGRGVFGLNTASTGFALGIQGQSASSDGRGIFGLATAPTGNTIGVIGLAHSTAGHGGLFHATATSGPAIGVRGQTSSPDGNGVNATNFATSGDAVGTQSISVFSTSGHGVVGQALATTGFTTGVIGQVFSTEGRGVFGLARATSGSPVGVLGEANAPGGVAIQGRGNNGARAGLFEGRVDINCPVAPCLFVRGSGVADLAENMPLAGRVAPGDVVVLTGTHDYGVARAARPYDTRVAGIISAQPRIVLQVRSEKPTAPVAMVGLVRAKATASNGSIGLGDLLTTSRVPGHLMRCPAARRCVGAIVGKALEPLATGEKQILVLLWRQ